MASQSSVINAFISEALHLTSLIASMNDRNAGGQLRNRLGDKKQNRQAQTCQGLGQENAINPNVQIIETNFFEQQLNGKQLGQVGVDRLELFFVCQPDIDKCRSKGDDNR